MYRITIEQVTWSEVVKQAWQKIADTGNERDDGPQYGYVDARGKEIDSTKILQQEVEELDVKAVIKAINGL